MFFVPGVVCTPTTIACYEYPQVQDPLPIPMQEFPSYSWYAGVTGQIESGEQNMPQAKVNNGQRQKHQKTQKASKKDDHDASWAQPQSRESRESREVKLTKQVITLNQTREEDVTTIPVEGTSVDNQVTPLFKTKLCKFSPFGLCCRGASCHFAHGEEELRSSPDFSRTSICPNLLEIGVCAKPGCPYAHSREELREVPGLLKTKMCHFHVHGGCYLGSRCRFAHDKRELIPEAVAASTTQPVSSLAASANALDHEIAKDNANINTEVHMNELNKGSNVAIDASPMSDASPLNASHQGVSTHYQGISPDNSPISTPRVSHVPPGIWYSHAGAEIKVTGSPKSTASTASHDYDPPTPDPVMARRMQENPAMPLQSLVKAIDKIQSQDVENLVHKEDQHAVNAHLVNGYVGSVQPSLQNEGSARPTWADLTLGVRS